METLVLKLVVTPVLIGAATLVGRRWGQAVGGWLVGLPLTSGPVAFFLMLDRGPLFAADAAQGSLQGIAAEAAFGLAYGWCARVARWPASLMAGTLAFAAAGTLLQGLSLSGAILLGTVLAALLAALRLMPRWSGAARGVAPPRWDLPARMLVATLLVLGLTSAAPILGPRLAGLLSTYPMFAGVLTVFAHRDQDRIAAVAVLRGLLLGLFSFAAFFVVLAPLLRAGHAGLAFAAAIAAALATQAVSLVLMRFGIVRW